MTILPELIRTTEDVVLGKRDRLREQQRAGIAAGLASGVNREYWLEQQRKFEGGG